MGLSSIFKIRNEATPALLDLLTSTTLGTNGAQYRHLDTRQRIQEADDPIFLSMERNEKVIANVTFCRRGSFWYVRYFAFSSFAQAGSKKKEEDKGNSLLKRELNTFFDEVFDGKHTEEPVQSMYAYIDPKNDRSKWMSENFGFSVVAHLATQTYSRVYPKRSDRLIKSDNWEDISSLVMFNFKDHQYFFTSQTNKPPFYILKDKTGEIIAFTRVTTVNWEIVRLPGKFGGFLTKMIPFIPVLNKLINPKKHTFLVPEIVYVKNNDAILLNELFSGVLADKKLNLLIWWTDVNEPIYRAVKDKMNWGLLNKLIGVAPVDVVQRCHPAFNAKTDNPVFVTAFDMV